MQFIRDKDNIVLMQLHNKNESRVILSSTENPDVKAAAYGLIPLEVHDLKDYSVITKYDFKTESVDIEPILKYTDKQFISVRKSSTDPLKLTWSFYKIKKDNLLENSTDTPMIVLDSLIYECNEEDNLFIDSILPDFRSTLQSIADKERGIILHSTVNVE